MDMENKASDYIREENLEVNESIPEKRSINFFDILKSETGEGNIDSYKNHPLNFNNSNGVSQILRGATGIFGNLNLAILDIMLGIFQLFIDKKSIVDNV